MGHWLLHVLGIDTQQSYPYDFWSGVGTQFKVGTLWLALILYRKHNCKRRWCPFLGHHPLTDPDTGETRGYCWRHHPGVKRKHWHDHHIRDVWERAQQHRGAQ